MNDDPDPWTHDEASRLYRESRVAWRWLSIVIFVAVLVAYGLDRVMHLIIPQRTSPDLKAENEASRFNGRAV